MLTLVYLPVYAWIGLVQLCTYPDEMVWVGLEDRQRLSHARMLLECQWYGLSAHEGEV